MFPEIVAGMPEDQANPLYDACMKVPMFEDRCHLLTQEKVSRVYSYISQNISPYEFCSMFKQC